MARVMVIHWGSRGGGPRFAARMTAALQELPGVEVSASFNRAAGLSNDLAPGRRFDVRTYRTRAQVVLGLPRLLVIAIRLRRYLVRESITTVYSPMFTIWQALAISLIVPKRVRYVASVHEVSPHPGDGHWLIRFCLRRDLARADQVATYSAFVASELRARRPDLDVFELHHGVDEAAFPVRELPPGGRVRVGFFGRIVDYKGLEVFCDAVRELHEVNPLVTGVVHGEGPVPPGLVSGTSGFIQWNLAWIDEEALEQTMRSFEVLLLPYREASQSGALSIAISTGTPAVVTPVGGLAAQAAAGGAIVADSLNLDAILAAVAYLIADPDRYRSVSATQLARAGAELGWHAAAVELARHFAR